MTWPIAIVLSVALICFTVLVVTGLAMFDGRQRRRSLEVRHRDALGSKP